jgi:glycosyltransferase involved in cell wall biosynthesis
MPVYNAEQYVGEAVRSISRQTFRDFELIVIDDGSTDRSPEILQSLANQDSRIAIHRQPNSGVGPSLNFGCSLARGAYVARMDADDISLPRRFEKQVAFLDAHSDVGVLGTWIQDVGQNGEAGPIWPLPTTAATIQWFLMFGNCLAHPTVMMRTDVIKRLQYNPAAAHVEDYDLWIRASRVTNLANIPEVLLKYRVLTHSTSSRHLSVQQQQALKLQRAARAELLSADIDEGVLPAPDMLLDLYASYRRKRPLSRGDEAEITLDVFRRIYLSGQMRTGWARLLPLVPRLFSMQALRKTIRFGRFYAVNFRTGFTTQRQAPE